MVFQNCVLFPHMTVEQNMAFGLELRKTPREEIRRRVGRAAEVLGIKGLLARRPGELSGGERQRVALGRAIVRQAQVFLFDEPLSNLDARLRDRMRREICRLHARLHATMIYVTHDQTEAMTVGQRLVVIRKGRIQQVADPDTLYKQPANCFVAQSIGSPAMNLFQGRIRQHDGRLVFDEGSFRMTLTGQWLTRLQSYCDRPIVLGVRPEHVGPAAQEPIQPGLRFRAEVEVIERLGAESHVQLGTGNSQFVWRVDVRRSPQVGERVELSVAAGHLHFFDAQTEEAVR